MKAKNKFIIVLGIICVIITALFCVSCSTNEQVDYTQKMLAMLNEKSQFKASEVFEFEFDRAYVLLPEECYLSGEGFAKAHNLDISIDEVESGVDEGVHRIIFVDENGDLVYCYKLILSDLHTSEYGMVMYPDTIIKKCDEAPKGKVMFEICSDEYY